MKKILKPAVWAIGLAMTASAVFAHGGATGIVKERMDAMGELAKAAKLLGGMARGKTKMDIDVIRQSALTIKGHAGRNMTGLFPEGSLHSPTEARPEIWSNWAEFESLAMELETRAGELAALGTQDAGGFRASFGAIAKTCSSCHEKFRIKKD